MKRTEGDVSKDMITLPGGIEIWTTHGDLEYSSWLKGDSAVGSGAGCAIAPFPGLRGISWLACLSQPQRCASRARARNSVTTLISTSKPNEQIESILMFEADFFINLFWERRW